MILRYIAEPGCEPSYATDGAAGIDLRAAEDAKPHYLRPIKIRTGLQVEIPPGYVGLVKGRSGLAFGRLLWGFNGVIDSDYRGEIAVQLMPFWAPGFTRLPIQKGDRIGQLLIVPVMRCELEPVSELSETARGDKGFGSTGTR